MKSRISGMECFPCVPLLVEEVLCLDVSLVDDLFLLAGTDFIRDLVPWLSALCPDFFLNHPQRRWNY